MHGKDLACTKTVQQTRMTGSGHENMCAMKKRHWLVCTVWRQEINLVCKITIPVHVLVANLESELLERLVKRYAVTIALLRSNAII
jgi:hypothetical protein